MVRGFFHIPGVILLLCSFVLLLLVSISLPYLPVFGIVRVHFEGGSATAQGQLSGLRVSPQHLFVPRNAWGDARMLTAMLLLASRSCFESAATSPAAYMRPA